MPTRKFDTILAASDIVRPGLLRQVIEWMRPLAPHAELLEPCILPRVLDALNILKEEDATFEKFCFETTISVRRGDKQPWQHFSTYELPEIAREHLEAFVRIRLPNSDSLRDRLDGEAPYVLNPKHGAVTDD